MRLNFRWPLQDAADAAGAGSTDDAAAAKATADKVAADKTAADKATADKAAADAASATKKDGEQTPEQKAAADAAALAAKNQAPAKYELKLPDGGLLHPSDLKVIEEQARKAGLSNDDAQAWVNEQASVVKAQSDAYYAETLADKDYGGEKMTETQRLATAAIDRIRPVGHPRREEFLAFIKRAGADNALPVVSFLADFGKLMAEDSVTHGRTAAGGSDKKAPEQVMYPNHQP
jgi:hypothetical protein